MQLAATVILAATVGLLSQKLYSVTEVIARRAEVTTAFWVVPSNIGDHVEKTVPWGVGVGWLWRSLNS